MRVLWPRRGGRNKEKKEQQLKPIQPDTHTERGHCLVYTNEQQGFFVSFSSSFGLRRQVTQSEMPKDFCFSHAAELKPVMTLQHFHPKSFLRLVIPHKKRRRNEQEKKLLVFFCGHQIQTIKVVSIVTCRPEKDDDKFYNIPIVPETKKQK